MAKKKLLFLGIVGSLIVLSMLSGVNALADNSFRSQGATGSGTFIHTHDGEPHDHFFTFTVSDGNVDTDGWLYDPNGRFYLIATVDKEVHMIVTSDQITRFKVEQHEDSKSIVFEGVATVKHHDADWEAEWQLTIEAVDNSPQGAGEDSIHIMLTAPNGEMHHMEGTLSTGNIAVRD